MAVICNKPLGPFEWLGRNLVETPTINKQGVVKDKVVYPKMKADEEPGRTHLFTNKLSVVRICRGSHESGFPWEEHQRIWASMNKSATMKLKGFMACSVSMVESSGYNVVPAASDKNPYHAHIIIPNYDIPYFEGARMISDILPDEVKKNLDRLRGVMTRFIIDPKEQRVNPCDICKK